MKLRSLICLFTGHVDSGKSQIIESVSNTKIIEREAGKITQSISAIPVNLKDLKELTKNFKDSLNLKIPGFLFIDSPGHAAFVNLRKRGGNLADMAVLVININEGIMPQTLEAIEVLKEFKTPFIIALNKIDLLPGWRSNEKPILENIKSQAQDTQNLLDKKLYEVLGKLHEKEIQSERYDRVSDYTKQIAIVPTSAKTKEGVPELLLVLLGLAQKFLEQNLETESNKPGKATILEIKKGKGNTCILDTILYDGKLRANDQIVIGSTEEPIVTKIRSMQTLEKEKLKQVKEIHASASVQILTPQGRQVLPGMPLQVANKDLDKIKEEVQKEVEEVVIETQEEGLIVKAESLGSLEAVTRLLSEKEIPIKKASLGNISKKDIIEAKVEKNPAYQAILGFNLKPIKSEIKIITSEVIYDLIDNYEKWEQNLKKEIESKQLNELKKPCKIQVLQGYIFRQSNPAVVGVEILSGTLKVGSSLMNQEGKYLTDLQGIQDDGKSVESAKKSEQVAVSLPKLTVGRQIGEKDILYTDLSEEDVKKLKELKNLMTQDELQTLKEIVTIKRESNPIFGI